jgi:hypothetical protein
MLYPDRQAFFEKVALSLPPQPAIKPPFHALSRDYFTREAHQHFATEAAAFFLLMVTTLLPLFNGANAVVELIRSTRGAF